MKETKETEKDDFTKLVDEIIRIAGKAGGDASASFKRHDGWTVTISVSQTTEED